MNAQLAFIEEELNLLEQDQAFEILAQASPNWLDIPALEEFLTRHVRRDPDGSEHLSYTL